MGTKVGKNKPIPGGERTMVLRVLHFFEEEKRIGNLLIPVHKALSRCCAATGVSLSTIARIKREEKQILESLPKEGSSGDSMTRTEVILPSRKRRRGRPKNKYDIDESTLNSIRNIINGFTERKEVPTLRKILAIAKTESNFPGQRETLRKILNVKLGYTFKRIPSKKRPNKNSKPENPNEEVESRDPKPAPYGAEPKPVRYIDPFCLFG